MMKPVVVSQSYVRKSTAYLGISILVNFALALIIIALWTNPIVKTLPVEEKVIYKPSYVPAYRELSEEDFKQLNCLALNIYHEARGELLAGKYSSAHSVTNRMKDKKFPNTACEVVYQKIKGVSQYSWISDGKSDAVNDQDSYNIALSVAFKVLFLDAEDITEGSLFYHKDDGKTRFSDAHYANIVKVGSVGEHIFYRRK